MTSYEMFPRALIYVTTSIKMGKLLGLFLNIELGAINFQTVLLQQDTSTRLNNLYPKYIKISYRKQFVCLLTLLITK